MVPYILCHTKWASNISEKSPTVIVLMVGSGTLGDVRLLKLKVGFIHTCCSIQTANSAQWVALKELSFF